MLWYIISMLIALWIGGEETLWGQHSQKWKFNLEIYLMLLVVFWFGKTPTRVAFQAPKMEFRNSFSCYSYG